MDSYTISLELFIVIMLNDFPVVNGTPGIIQDPIDLLLAKCFSNNNSIGFQYLQYSWPFVSKIIITITEFLCKKMPLLTVSFLYH